MSALLQVKDVTAGYGRTTVLRGVSLEAAVGEVVCVLGRNGAGKTTLLRALMGMLSKKGAVRLDGVDISHWKGHRIHRAGMVWVPQEDTVFPGLTVLEHLDITLGGRNIDAGVRVASDLFPPLAERLDQEAQTLSGGERKMLSLAQALIVSPRVVLMDEPTEGVAPVVVQQLIPAIRLLAETAAIVLVEQNLDTALAVGSRAFVLEQGTIVESGDVHGLYESGVLERRLAL